MVKRSQRECDGRTEVIRREFVDCSQPNGDSCVDTNYPGKIEKVIDGTQEYRKLRNGNNRTH